MNTALMTTKQREPHPTCADRVHSNLKDREEQLQDGELEGLCFDYVEPHSFPDQVEGYWRWQLSYGGPSDELRALVNENKEIHRLEYWFLDWYDGAHVVLDEKKNARMWNEVSIMLEAS